MSSSRRVRLSREAEDDLREILQHTFDSWGEQQQDAYAAILTGAFQHLARFPNLGRLVRDRRFGDRQDRVEQHVIFSEAAEQEVHIARILHRRMDAIEDGGD